MQTVLDLIADIVEAAPDRPPMGDKSAPVRGDRGDRGDNPRGYCTEAGATQGRQGATFGDSGATEGEKSPQVAPQSPPIQPAPLLGESPQSPLSPAPDPSPDRPCWRWEIRQADGTWITAMVTPPETLAEIRAAHPDALELHPLYDLTPAMETAA